MEYHEKEIVVILNKILTVSNNREKKQANRRPDLAKCCEDIHQGLADFHTLGVSSRVVFKSRSLSFNCRILRTFNGRILRTFSRILRTFNRRI